MSTSLLFSGQGSQYVGMMKDIIEKYPKAKDMVDAADELLGYKLSEIFCDGPAETLKETRFTQPSLFVHSSIIFDLIKSKLSFHAAAGHSIGEYAALYAANVLTFEDALKLVALRGKLMFEAGEHEPGTMFAIINLDDDIVDSVCRELTENGNGKVVVPANYNSPGQIVVSGSADYLRDNAGKFKDAGARIVKELQVSGAFHSPLLKPAKENLESAISDIKFNNASVPIYTNVYAEPETDAGKLKEALISQMMSPVKWTQTLNNMKLNGINRYFEIGPGNVLQGLVKRTLADVEIDGFDKADDVDKILA